MKALLQSLWLDESGQATVEYALVIGLAAVAVVTAIVAFRTQLIALWTAITGVVTAQTAQIAS